MPSFHLLCCAAATAVVASAALVREVSTGAVLPPWPPTYNMSLSTMIMPCNSSGFFNASFGASFGLCDYDWSNAKALWSRNQPYMNCEEDLVTQAEATKAINPASRVWVYRNTIKALPWFTSVREKLEDPAYFDWFMPFANASGDTATTRLYHDFEQTPADLGNCGTGVQCGEYLFDLRNPAVRAWLSGEYINSSTGLGNAAISGFYLDDGWNAGGPTEMNASAVAEMGLTPADIADLTAAWEVTMQGIQNASLALGGYTYTLLDGGQSAPGRNQTDPQAQCASWLRDNCGANASIRTQALAFGFTRVQHQEPFPLPAAEQDLATFLLVRGDYAWLGYGWLGCSQPWERPAGLDVDYGTPVDFCSETEPGVSGVFTRHFTRATVTMDCNSWNATIVMTA